jgi:hypothetical protein
MPGLRSPHPGHGLHCLRSLPLVAATASQRVSKALENRLEGMLMRLLLVLLVIIVPHVVPLALVSTALGAHKSVSTHFPRTEPGSQL